MPAKATSPLTFESVERLGKKAAGVASRAIGEVVNDAKESLLGDIRKLSPEEKQQALVVEQQNKQKLQLIRQNIAAIDQQMAEYRKKREKQPDEQRAEQQQQIKKFEEKQKKDSSLSRLIKSRKGTKEGMQRASG